MLLRLKTIFYAVVYSLGGLQEVNIDYFENCGIVDKSSSASRWAIVAEEYSLSSSSE